MTDPNTVPAPGWPGTAPTWTSSAKDVVTTALGASRVWATLGFGIVNEIYWPSAGEPQLRDLGFIVAGRSGWHELKRINRYTLSRPKPYIPLPRVVHEGVDYRLTLELVPDPLRDVVLVDFHLEGKDVRLYALLAPHLGGSGEHNNAVAGADLVAWKDHHALFARADCGFSQSSAGFVGSSDGWQDFARNGRMSWRYTEARDGNVALMAELAENSGTLAIGFGNTIEGAQTLARSSLAEGVAAARERFSADWERWAETLDIPDAPEAVLSEAYISATVLRVHDGKSFPGALVASLSIPWGNTSNSIGGYHLIWTRDAVEAGLAMAAIGKVRGARHMLSYLVATQHDGGGWCQNYFPDGRPFWTGVQLDEVCFPILLAARLGEQNALDGLGGVPDMVCRAARYIVQRGPGSPQDRWEENSGISPFTLAVEIAALVAAAEHLPPEQASYALSLADYWNERIEDWTYVENGPLAAGNGIDGYYVRVAPPADGGGLRGRIDLRNRRGETIDAAALIGMEYLYLARVGLREAGDRRIQNTLALTERLLKVETPLGTAYHRYNEDGYGEHADGAPFDGEGIGRAWPLLTGERGHLEVLLGRDPLPYLEAMARMTGPGGLIPEQVWDSASIPDRWLFPGKPTGSAMPLVWAHAEFLKLLWARRHGRPIELLASVERRYHAQRPSASTWHWRTDAPIETLPPGRALLVEQLEPFRLHYGFDGWRSPRDIDSQPLGLGMHGVRLEASRLKGRAALDFTCYFSERGVWQGGDHRVALRGEM
jgi:glucoamylase